MFKLSNFSKNNNNINLSTSKTNPSRLRLSFSALYIFFCLLSLPPILHIHFIFHCKDFLSPSSYFHLKKVTLSFSFAKHQFVENTLEP